MKNLMLSTALVTASSLATLAHADSHTSDIQAGASAEQMVVPAFRVSDFTGKDLHVLDSEASRALSQERADADRSLWERAQVAWDRADVFTGERDEWETVGNIADVVLSKDGSVRGVLIDIGGFLGIGAHTVMVDMDELYFVADTANTDDLGDFLVVAATSREALEALPEFEDTQMSFSFAAADRDAPALPGTEPESATDATADTNATAAAARTEVPEGYEVLPPQDRTTDRLAGADVYGREGEIIATIDDLVIGTTGEITHAVIDVGGFLGLGSHSVALEIDDIDILWNDAEEDVRVQVTMTREEMESLPEYEG